MHVTRSLSGGLWPLGRSLAGAALLALVVAPGAFAQTAAPPLPTPPLLPITPGTVLVQASLPAVPPFSVPAVVGAGTLAVVPTDVSGGVAAVNADLGGGFQATAIVAADPLLQQAIRIAVPPADQVVAPLPDDITGPTLILSVDVFDADTGALLQAPITLGVRPPADVDPQSLTVLRVDPVTGELQVLPATWDADNGVLVLALSPAPVQTTESPAPSEMAEGAE